MRRPLFVLLFSQTILFASVPISHAQYSTIQLTINAHDSNPQINNHGDVVWMRYDGSDYDIFLYDGTSTTQLTNSAYTDMEPQINDLGMVVWTRWAGPGGSGEIFFYDGMTTHQMTSNAYEDSSPRINNYPSIVFRCTQGLSH